MMDKYINGNRVPDRVNLFAYDGCHKIYLLENTQDEFDFQKFGYKFHPIEELPLFWLTSCPLRFISSGDLTKHYVGQCETALFEGWDIPLRLKQDIELLNEEIREANGGTE